MKNSPQSLYEKYKLILEERDKHPGQPIAVFCQQHGIKPWTYYYWKRRFPKSPSQIFSGKGFIPLTIDEPHRVGYQSKPHYELRFFNGTTMLISEKLDHSALSLIVRAVADIPSC